LPHDPPPFTSPGSIERVERDKDLCELKFEGGFTIDDAPHVWQQLQALRSKGPAGLRIDLSKVERLDGSIAALLSDAVARFLHEGRFAQLVGAPPAVERLLKLYHAEDDVVALKAPPLRQGFLDQIGRFTAHLIGETRAGFEYFGGVLDAAFRVLRDPRSMHWRAVTRIMEHSGADSLPIVLLINFLVGLIMAFQAAVQLKQVGANIFVADLVGISITRELGPLMTAIIVAGRSGAAFAAELGTMNVSEEVDALKTMGVSPYKYLVLPRLLAACVVVPLLTLFADLVAIFGGMIVGVASLDLTIETYAQRTVSALDAWDVFSGVLKSVVFAAAIALIACQRGLSARGGAEGVGRSTTSSVVTILFHLVLIDSIFTVLFHLFDL